MRVKTLVLRSDIYARARAQHELFVLLGIIEPEALYIAIQILMNPTPISHPSSSNATLNARKNKI